MFFTFYMVVLFSLPICQNLSTDHRPLFEVFRRNRFNYTQWKESIDLLRESGVIPTWGTTTHPWLERDTKKKGGPLSLPLRFLGDSRSSRRTRTTTSLPGSLLFAIVSTKGIKDLPEYIEGVSIVRHCMSVIISRDDSGSSVLNGRQRNH